MPIFDFNCTHCATEYRDEFFQRLANPRDTYCGFCGQQLTPLLSLIRQPVAFKEGFYSQLTGKDKIYFTSKNQLRAECEKRGKYSDYVS